MAEVNTALANPQASVYQPVPIAIGVSQSTIVYLSEHRSLFPGVAVSFTAERTYPYGDTAAQVLGYIGDIDAAELKALAKYGYTANDVIGQSGVEASYERWLRGQARLAGHQGRRPRQPGRDRVDDGARSAATTSSSTSTSTSRRRSRPRSPTRSRSSRRSNLHGRLRRGGRPRSRDRCGARHGVGAHLQPVAGGWAASPYQHYQYLTSKPPTTRSCNRAIQGSWAPGSTFKLATATAALNDGLLASLGELHQRPGSYQIRQPCSGVCTYYDNTNNGQHEAGQGIINVTTALTASPTTCSSTPSAPTTGTTRPTTARRRSRTSPRQYGFGQLTGVDLPNEYSGQVDSPRLRQVQFAEAPQDVPELVLRHRRQHRDGLRPGRDARHAPAGGGGLRHVRHRRHPVRAAGRELDRLAVGQGRQAASSPG